MQLAVFVTLAFTLAAYAAPIPDFIPEISPSTLISPTDAPAAPDPSPTIVIPLSELTAFVPSPVTTPFVPVPVESTSVFVPVVSVSEFVPVVSVSEFVPVISVSEPAPAPVQTPFIGHLPILPPGGVFPKRADFVPVPELSPVILQTDPAATPAPSPTIVIPFSELTAFVPSPATTPFVPVPAESSEFVPVPIPTSEFVPVPVLSVPPPPPVPTVIIGHLPILPPGGVFPKRVPDEAGAIPVELVSTDNDVGYFKRRRAAPLFRAVF